MPMLRLVYNPLGSMGATEADLQNHEKPALSFGANGFLNTLRKSTDTSLEALVLNYAGPAGWLGRNVSLFTTGEDVDVKSWGFDSQFKWRGFAAQAEGFFGQAEGETSGVKLAAYGWYGQAAYFFSPAGSTSPRATRTSISTATSAATPFRRSPPRRPTISAATA